MYTNEEVCLLKQYPALSVAELAKKLNKSERSIIGKLSRLGIYQKREYEGKRGEIISKLEIVSELEIALNMKLNGLEKSPKEVLMRMRNKLGGRAITIS